MTSKGIQLMQLIITQSWRLFTEWHLPFVNFTPAQLYFFVLLTPIVVGIFKSIFNLSLDSIYNSGSSEVSHYQAKHYKKGS